MEPSSKIQESNQEDPKNEDDDDIEDDTTSNDEECEIDQATLDERERAGFIQIGWCPTRRNPFPWRNRRRQ